MLALVVVSSVVLGWHGRHFRDLAALQIDVHTALVLLGGVLQAQLLADLLDARLDLLHVVRRVIALADNDVEMGLASCLRVSDASLENILGLLHKLSVQVNRVIGNAVRSVVSAEDVLGRLFVVLLHFGGVLLALVAQLLGFGAVAVMVGTLGLGTNRHVSHVRGGNNLAVGMAPSYLFKAGIALLSLCSRQVAKTVVLSLRFIRVGLAVVRISCCVEGSQQQVRAGVTSFGILGSECRNLPRPPRRVECCCLCMGMDSAIVEGVRGLTTRESCLVVGESRSYRGAFIWDAVRDGPSRLDRASCWALVGPLRDAKLGPGVPRRHRLVSKLEWVKLRSHRTAAGGEVACCKTMLCYSPVVIAAGNTDSHT